MTASNDARAMMEFEAGKKSMGVSYLLWLFLGGVGAHRYYNGRVGSGVLMTVLFVLGFLTAGLTFIITGIWALVDAFLIPGWVRGHNQSLIRRL